MTTRVPYSMTDAPVNVRAFGAKGDGVTNDAAAIAAAVAAARVVHFPIGTYLIGTDSAIALLAGATVYGDGPGTIIKKTSGTADIFSTSANDVTVRDLRLEGPNNTGCDGIVFDNCSRVTVRNVQGHQLSSTVTVGATTNCDEVLIERVVSTSNTQQGVHLNKATRAVVRDCVSTSVGTTNLHHGFYVGNCTDVEVVNCRAETCSGTGVHVYAQSSFAGARVSVRGGRFSGNGTSGTSLRGGIGVACASGSSWTDVLVEGAVCYNNSAYNLYVANVAQIDIRQVIANGNAKATANGIYLEMTRAGNYSASIVGCRTFAHGSGIRLVASAGTVDEVLIDNNLIHGNDGGIFASGAVMDNFLLGSHNVYRGNTTSGNLIGTFEALGEVLLADGVTAPGTLAGVARLYVDTADGDLKVKFGDGVVKTIAIDT